MDVMRPGIWATARYTRQGLIVHVQCWTLASKVGEAPGAPTFIGACLLRALHVALGGDPSRSGDLVAAGGHLVLELFGGTLQKMDVWPAATEKEDVWDAIWPEIKIELVKNLGIMGAITEPTPGVIEVAYGPASALAACMTPAASPVVTPDEVRPDGTKLVSLSAQMTRPRGVLELEGARIFPTG